MRLARFSHHDLQLLRKTLSAPPTLVSFLIYFLEPVLKSLPLRSIGHIGNPFAKLVLCVPKMLAVLRISGWRRLAIPKRRRWRRLTNRYLAHSRDSDLSLSMS